MSQAARRGWRTIFWLTIYVGWLPVTAVTILAFALTALVAENDDWFVLLVLLYFVFVWAGANFFARHFKR